MVVSDEKNADSDALTAEILSKFSVVGVAMKSRAENRALLELHVHQFLDLVKEEIEKRTDGHVISGKSFAAIKVILMERHGSKIMDVVQDIRNGINLKHASAFMKALSDSVVVQHQPSEETLFRSVQSKFIKGGRGKMRNSGGSSKKAGHRV